MKREEIKDWVKQELSHKGYGNTFYWKRCELVVWNEGKCIFARKITTRVSFGRLFAILAEIPPKGQLDIEHAIAAATNKGASHGKAISPHPLSA